MARNARYGDHLDTLIALISYLALVPRQSRTGPGLARDLSLGPDEVQATLTGFPGVFRKSQRTSKDNGEHYYTLHVRYALRNGDQEPTSGDQPALRADLLAGLLQFVTQQAAQESAFDQFTKQLAENHRGIWVAASAAVVAAVASVLAAILGH